MHCNDNVCIKVGNNVTDSFIPPLFETTNYEPVKFHNNKPVGCVVWADDILLMSESDEGLQNMISKLSVYSTNNH